MSCSMSLVRPGLGSYTHTTIRSEFDTVVTSSSSSSFRSSSPPSTLARFLILTVFLLVTCVVMSTDASPVRHRRDTVSQLVNMSKLRNPCEVDSSATVPATTMDCSLGDPVKLSADLAKNAVSALQKQLGSNTCTGMSLDDTFRVPTMATTMTNEEKLREIYKSLVKHYAFMQALTVDNSATEQSFRSSLASLKTLQCSMLCHLGQTSALLDEAVTAVGNINVDTSQNESGQILRNCLIVNSTLQLLDVLLDVAQG